MNITNNNEVYTTLDNLNIGMFVNVKSYKALDEKYQKWIEEKTSELLKNRTYPEKKLSSILKESIYHVEEQPFFLINGKGYFLDFFIPEFNVAIELNGDVHRSTLSHAYDWRRDSAFFNIGIKTIRLANREVYLKDFKERLDVYFNRAVKNQKDSTRYYDKPNCVKFEGKRTKFQVFFDNLLKEINSMPNGSSILIKTKETYIYRFVNKRYSKNDDCENKDRILKIKQAVKDKGMILKSKFNGNTSNMKGKKKTSIIENNKKVDSESFDKVVIAASLFDCSNQKTRVRR